MVRTLAGGLPTPVWRGAGTPGAIEALHQDQAGLECLLARFFVFLLGISIDSGTRGGSASGTGGVPINVAGTRHATWASCGANRCAPVRDQERTDGCVHSVPASFRMKALNALTPWPPITAQPMQSDPPFGSPNTPPSPGRLQSVTSRIGDCRRRIRNAPESCARDAHHMGARAPRVARACILRGQLSAVFLRLPLRRTWSPPAHFQSAPVARLRWDAAGFLNLIVAAVGP